MHHHSSNALHCITVPLLLLASSVINTVANCVFMLLTYPKSVTATHTAADYAEGGYTHAGGRDKTTGQATNNSWGDRSMIDHTRTKATRQTKGIQGRAAKTPIRYQTPTAVLYYTAIPTYRRGNRRRKRNQSQRTSQTRKGLYTWCGHGDALLRVREYAS